MSITDSWPFIIPGLLYGIGALGIAITYRYLHFPDFTVLGSVVLGAIVCVNVANSYNPVLAVIAGVLAAGALGAITALLHCRLGIDRVLAGILTYTASFTFSYLLTSGGLIDLKPGRLVLFPQSSGLDLALICVIAIILIGAITMVIRSSYGSLVLAMTATNRFVEHRHRYKDRVFAILLVLGNMIVGLAACLYAARDRVANVPSHQDFLPISLGAIFGGNAVAMFLSHKIMKVSVGTTDPAHTTPTPESGPGHLAVVLRRAFSPQGDDTKELGYILCANVLGAVFIMVITGLSGTPTVSRLLHLSSGGEWQYMIAAVVTVVAIWWADARGQ